MYLLNEFARTQGSKDKKQRLRKELLIAGGLATAGLLGAAALKHKKNIESSNIFNGELNKAKTELNTVKTKIQNSISNTTKKLDNHNVVKSRQELLQAASTSEPNSIKNIFNKPGKANQKTRKKQVVDLVNKLKGKGQYFSSSLLNYL